MYVRPFLKWAGGKFTLLNKILQHLPPGQRLVEPFAGACSIFINAPFQHFILAESNPDLIDLYQQLQEEGDTFIDYCATYFTPDMNNSKTYYKHREQFNHCRHKRTRAALFLYLNRHGYNGLCRYNQQGIYNVPFGTYTRPYFPRKEMQHFHQKSQQAIFVYQDFRATFEKSKKGDVIYCDPPYIPLSKTAFFTGYSGHPFKEADQLDLVQASHRAQKKGCTVIISNHDTPFTQQHYTDCNILTFPVARHISCHAASRGHAVQEILAIFTPCQKESR